MSFFVAGLDLGQQRDYSALAIAEVTGKRYKQRFFLPDSELGVLQPQDKTIEGPPCTFALRHLERFELGTSYPDQVTAVEKRLRAVPTGALLAVDATGVGRAVMDLLDRQGLRALAITITGGDQVQSDGREFRVPKRDLVSTLLVALQSNRLRIAKALPMAPVLLEELLNFRAKVSVSGHDSYEALRESVHDDLVLATAIACWTAERAVTEAYENAVGCLKAAELNARLDTQRVSPY